VCYALGMWVCRVLGFEDLGLEGARLRGFGFSRVLGFEDLGLEGGRLRGLRHGGC